MRIATKVVACLLMLGLGAWGALTFTSSNVRAAETLTFRVKDKKVVFNGGHAGDSYTFHHAFYRNGDKVGTAETFGATRKRSGEGGQNIFTSMAQVPGGKIAYVSKFHFVAEPQTFTGAITGGTGRYAGAQGTVRVEQRAHGAVITFFIQ